MAGGLLVLQIVGGLEYTEGGSLYTRASMIAAMVTLAVLPVFIHAARKRGQGFIATCLGISFLAFLAYSLPATTGRTGEIKEVKAAAATDLASVKAELATITTTLKWALPDKISECAGAPDPLPPDSWPLCRQKTGTVAALEDRQVKLKAEIEAGKGSETGDLGSDLWAWVLSWFGATAATVRKISVLSFAVGLDFVIWSLVALGTHSWPVSLVSNSGKPLETKAVTVGTGAATGDPELSQVTDRQLAEFRELVTGPVPPKPTKKRKASKRAKRREDVIAKIRKQTLAGNKPSFSVVRSRYKLTNGTAHRWLKEATEATEEVA